MTRCIRNQTRRSSPTLAISVAFLSLMLTLTSCGGANPEDPEQTSENMVYPDRAAGFEDIEEKCNDADKPPDATRPVTERWAAQDVRVICVDETDHGIFVAQDLSEVEVTEELITYLTPGEPIAEPNATESESTRVRFVVDNEVYAGRMVYTSEF